MTKQTINVGATANDKQGDSLRAAFQKVNANFTELYEAVGLSDTGQDTALTFTGSTISTDDSSSITVDRATTISSNLTVGGDILPQTANGGDLGSSSNPWRSLYVSNNTIYLGGIALGINGAGDLTLNGETFGPDRLTNGAYSLVLGSDGSLTANNLQGITSDDQIVFRGAEVTQISVADGPYINCWNQSGNQYIDLVAHDGGSGYPTWRFDTYGGLTFPDSNTISTAGNTFRIQAGNGNLLKLGDPLNSWTFDQTTGMLTVPEVSNENLFIQGAEIGSTNSGIAVSANNNIVLGTDILGTANYWTFGTNGSVTFPNATVQTTAYTGYHTGDMTGSVFADDSTIMVNAVDNILQAVIVNTQELHFTTNNKITVGTSEDFEIQYGNGSGSNITSLLTGASGTVITADPNTSTSWTFTADGNITFPDLSIQTTAYPGTAVAAKLPYYANTSARNAAIPSPENGMMVIVAGSVWFYGNTVWLQLVGTP